METTFPSVVLIRDSYMSSWRDMLPVLEKYSNQLKIQIRLKNVHCSYEDASNDPNVLTIYFYAVPNGFSGNRGHTTIPEAFGIKLGSDQMDAITAAPNANTIRDDKGTIVAEYFRDTLYVLFNLPEGRNAGELMDKILQAFLAKYPIKDYETRKRMIEQKERRIRKESPANFRTVFNAGLKDRLTTLNAQERELKEKEGRLMLQLNQIRAEQEGIEKLKKIAKVPRVGRSRTISEMYKNLSKLSKSGYIIVDSTSIRVDMGQIDIEYKGNVYDIGHFELVITLAGSRKGVKCYNRTRTVGNYFHPHIDHDGDSCLGNISKQVHDLLNSMELEVLVTLMFAHLQSYTAGDSYANVTNWPIKTAKEKS